MRIEDKTPASTVVVLQDCTVMRAPCAREILTPLYGNAEEAMANE